MSDLNSMSVVGRLTADATTRAIGNSNVVEFTIANNTGFGQYAYTNFIKCNAWGKQAQSVLQWLKKGKQVAVSGTFENRKWQGQDGLQHDNWLLTVQGQIVMMADPQRAEASNSQEPSPEPPPFTDDPVY